VVAVGDDVGQVADALRGERPMDCGRAGFASEISTAESLPKTRNDLPRAARSSR